MSISVHLNERKKPKNTQKTQKNNQDLYTIFPAEHISVHDRPGGLSSNK